MAAVMAPLELTPSKTVSSFPPQIATRVVCIMATANFPLQTANTLQDLSVTSPAKKLDFGTTTDQNGIIKAKPLVGLPKISKPIEMPAISETPVEADEPLLRENPNRFVLFPIKYHEVSCYSRVVYASCLLKKELVF